MKRYSNQQQAMKKIVDNNSTIKIVAKAYSDEKGGRKWTPSVISQQKITFLEDFTPVSAQATVKVTSNFNEGSFELYKSDKFSHQAVPGARKKQFYTIVTADGQQYYLVIDMSAAYTDDDGVNVTPDDGTVYFLTSVSNQNLLNFVNGNEQTLPQNSLAENNGIDDQTVTPDMDETTEETTEEAEPEPLEKS